MILRLFRLEPKRCEQCGVPLRRYDVGDICWGCRNTEIILAPPEPTENEILHARIALLEMQNHRLTTRLQAADDVITTLTDALPAASAVLSDDTMTTIDDAIARYRAA